MSDSVDDNLLQRIEARHEQLTRQQKKVAAWIVRTYPQVAFASAAKVAVMTGVSEASVVRLATALGYEGYTALHEAARAGLGNTLFRSGRSGSEPAGQAGFVGSVLHQDIANLQNLREHLREEDVLAAVRMILAAPHIYTTGVRISYDLALHLAQQLQWMLGNRVRALDPSPNSLAIDVAGLEPGDALVAFSFPVYTKASIQVADVARQKGCRVIGITDNRIAPLVSRSDVALLAPIQSQYIWNSYVGVSALIDCLLHGVALAASGPVKTSMPKIEEAYRRLELLHDN